VRLANLLRLADAPEAARAGYEAALRLDPALPEAHQGLAYVLDATDPVGAARHRALGFADRVLTITRYRGKGQPVRVLRLVSARGGNIPTGRILDDRQCLTHTLVVEFADPAMALPAHDVVFNAIGDADRCERALSACNGLLARTGARVINAPDAVLATTRVETARRLGGLEGVVAPRMALLPRAAFTGGVPEGFALPFLLRSPGFHTGEHFVRVDNAADLDGAVAGLPGEMLMAIEYLNAFGSDGAARKYRVMLIGGVVMPLHLAIGGSWKLHYYTADMAKRAEFRAEEAAFLNDMDGVLGPVATAALYAIAAKMGLDYGGIDFALAPDGRLILFEANATMVIVPPPPDAIWDYRRPAIDRALTKAQNLIR
jgi:glutathione synthase/RimK-type ligase-like ATP-grasp enzyme